MIMAPSSQARRDAVWVDVMLAARSAAVWLGRCASPRHLEEHASRLATVDAAQQ